MSEPVVHLHPGKDTWKLPCCKKFIFFMPDTDLVTKDPHQVTCEGYYE